MRISLLFTGILLSSTMLVAQTKDGFKWLQKRDYAAALKAFQNDLDSPKNSIPATFGALQAANGLEEEAVWLPIIARFEPAQKALEKLDEKAKKKLFSQYRLDAKTMDQAYQQLFGKVIKYLEKTDKPERFRNAFVDIVTVIPPLYQNKFNKILISQRTNPLSERKHITGTHISPKATYVDRKPPIGSALEMLQGVNTAGSEYIPIVSADGQILYFVAEGRVDNFMGEDIFYCQRMADGSWSEPAIDTFFSGPGNEAVVSMSADGNNLVLFIGGKPHISTRNESGWNEPRPIMLPKAFAWIGVASITRNGEALLFEAKETVRSDIDIYVSLQRPDGNWGLPFPVGSVINTPNPDRTPFLHSDFKTLYFSSTGHGGYGSFDVFKSTRLDDTWKNWSVPENLGPSINTSKNEEGFYIPPSGKVAYLASRTDGFQDQDLMRIPLDASAQPENQVVITGQLLNTSGAPQQGKIIVEDAKTSALLQTVTPRPDGAYTFSVPKTAQIQYYASGDSLISTQKTYIDASKYKGEVAEEIIVITTVSEAARGGKALELRDLQFDFAQSDLRPDAQAELKRIYQSIQKFDWYIEVGGHTDNVGSESSNLELSTRRAAEVRNYLVSLGYPAQKITFKGYGMQSPIEGNDTEAGRARNRRVEIRVR